MTARTDGCAGVTFGPSGPGVGVTHSEPYAPGGMSAGTVPSPTISVITVRSSRSSRQGRETRDLVVREDQSLRKMLRDIDSSYGRMFRIGIARRQARNRCACLATK